MRQTQILDNIYLEQIYQMMNFSIFMYRRLTHLSNFTHLFQIKMNFFQIIQLNTLKCVKSIIFANYEKYHYKKNYYNYSIIYIEKNNTITFNQKSQRQKTILIFLNLVTNKIIRKIPLSSYQTIKKFYLLKNQTVICLKHQSDQVDLYQIST
ncbi:unnamed protein product [Paramecium sonneborni]|uniref:Uncharacterized protein n=1 Tax=Paramecium sonneborni TaxID=65129 RepID=A0A8S1R3H3_9CILI|nr:unnamed protein product [Paramecium sonneborni]